MPYQQQIVDPFRKGVSQLRASAGFMLDGMTIPSTTAPRRGVEQLVGTATCRKHQNFAGPLYEIHAEGNNIEPTAPVTIEVDLPVTKCGRSLQLSGWVRGGLEYVEKSGRRYLL